VVASFFQVEASRLQFGSRGSGRWGFRKNTWLVGLIQPV
jgi:hypothetical protein